MRLQTLKAIVLLLCSLIVVCGCSEIDTRIELVASFEESGDSPPFVAMHERPVEPTAIVISTMQNADVIMKRHDLHHLYLVSHDCSDADASETLASWYPEANAPGGRRASVADPDWVAQTFEMQVDSRRHYHVAVVPRDMIQNNACLQLRAGAMWGLGRLTSNQMVVNQWPNPTQP